MTAVWVSCCVVLFVWGAHRASVYKNWPSLTLEKAALLFNNSTGLVCYRKMSPCRWRIQKTARPRWCQPSTSRLHRYTTPDDHHEARRTHKLWSWSAFTRINASILIITQLCNVVWGSGGDQSDKKHPDDHIYSRQSAGETVICFICTGIITESSSFKAWPMTNVKMSLSFWFKTLWKCGSKSSFKDDF